MIAQVPTDPPEARLLDTLHRIQRNPYEWRAAYLHLSRLRPQNRREYKLRVAAGEFEPLLRRFEGEVHRLSDGDIVVLCKGAGVAEMNQAVLRVRYLFSDDPLVSRAPDDEAGDGGANEARLCRWYDLGTAYDALRQRTEYLLVEVEGRHARKGGAAEAVPAPPLDPHTLVQVERGLSTVDIAALVRRQPVCALVSDEPPQAVFTEFYVDIGDLARALGAGVDLTASRWLFQYLTAALDERLLATVAEDADAAMGPASLNLNVATLLSPAFMQFDHRSRGGGRKFLIELQLTDIYAEPGVYVFARDLVRRRGHRICLDGLHHLHLPLVDRARLGADFVKVRWSQELPDDVDGAPRDELKAAIRRTGVERVILCRCGSGDAVRWGQELGIRLFQGRYIDSRLRAQRSPSIAAAREAIRSVTG